jgi:hypothetical protein
MYEGENIISKERWNMGNLKPFQWLWSKTLESFTVGPRVEIPCTFGIWQADTFPVQLFHSVGTARSSTRHFPPVHLHLTSLSALFLQEKYTLLPAAWQPLQKLSTAHCHRNNSNNNNENTNNNRNTTTNITSTTPSTICKQQPHQPHQQQRHQQLKQLHEQLVQQEPQRDRHHL